MDNVPKELLLNVFSFLEYSDLCSANAVCTYWYYCSEDQALWKWLSCRDFVTQPFLLQRKKSLDLFTNYKTKKLPSTYNQQDYNLTGCNFISTHSFDNSLEEPLLRLWKLVPSQQQTWRQFYQNRRQVDYYNWFQNVNHYNSFSSSSSSSSGKYNLVDQTPKFMDAFRNSWCLHFNPYNSLLAAGNTRRLSVIDLASHPIDTELYASDSDDDSTATMNLTLEVGSDVRCVQSSWNAVDPILMAGTLDSSLLIWTHIKQDLNVGVRTRSTPDAVIPHDGFVMSLFYDDERIFTGTGNRLVNIFDRITLKPILSLTHHNALVRSIQVGGISSKNPLDNYGSSMFSPHVVASGDDAGYVFLSDAREPGSKPFTSWEMDTCVHSLHWQGWYLGAADSGARIWDLRRLSSQGNRSKETQSSLLCRIKDPKDTYALQFDQNKLLYGNLGGNLKIWDIRSPDDPSLLHSLNHSTSALQFWTDHVFVSSNMAPNAVRIFKLKNNM